MTRADEVRPAERMPVPDSWIPDRPGEVVHSGPPRGRQFGSPGPDQGFGLKLARQIAPRLQLAEHEHLDDAVAGCAAVGLKRAALWGRAPVIGDMELAYTVWGFLSAAPRELVEFRRTLFQGAHHEYWSQRAIADRVPETTLRLTPADVAGRLSDWRQLVDVT
jgi:hypothetical protein